MSALKLLVIGLDGATWDVITPLMAQGQLPHLQCLVEGGASGSLRSTIPPVTAPAWSSFMTGLNPGKHGIFQWRTYDPTQYTCLDERIVTSERLAGRTFWDILGRQGYRVGVITVPMTYPVWEVNGYLLSGYPCPDSKQNYTYPPEWAETLSAPYNFSADYYLNASEDEIWRQGLAMLERRTSLALDLIHNKQIDICVLVLGEIDRAQHDFWKYVDPRFPHYHDERGKRYREVIADHYRVSDEQIGRLLASVSEETTVVVMSDHGAGPHPMRYFHTNAWLEKHGWLQRRGRDKFPDAVQAAAKRTLRWAVSWGRRTFPFEERLRRALPARFVHQVRSLSLNIADIFWSRTLAFRFPMYHPAEGIEINLRGRQPEGIVEPGLEYETLRDEIIEALRAARDPETGEKIVAAVYRREELYTGEYLEIAPDIVFITEDDYKADCGVGAGSVMPVPLQALDKYNGLHRLEGIFVARGPHIQAGALVSQAEIIDIAPTLLYALGEEVPLAMDGRILLGAFQAQFVQEHLPRYAAMDQGAGTPPKAATTEISATDSEDMRKKLQGLGYIS